MNRTNSIVPIILLLIIFSGESYAQWQRTNLPDGVRVNTIKIRDPFIFAGTDGEGIFISTDDGENWTSSNKGLQDTIIHTVMILGNSILAGTETGVSVSTDNGDNWRSINSGLSGLGVCPWRLAEMQPAIQQSLPDRGTGFILLRIGVNIGKLPAYQTRQRLCIR